MRNLHQIVDLIVLIIDNMHAASTLQQDTAAYSWSARTLTFGDSVTYFSTAVSVFKPLISSM